MTTETVWKTYNGIDVIVQDNGDFCAEVNGIFLRDGVWEHLRLKIETEKKTSLKSLKLELDCIVLTGDSDEGTYTVKPLILAGLNRKDHSFKWSEPADNARIVYILPNTQKNASLLEQKKLKRPGKKSPRKRGNSLRLRLQKLACWRSPDCPTCWHPTR